MQHRLGLKNRGWGGAFFDDDKKDELMCIKKI